MNENMSLHYNIFEQVKDYFITTGVLLIRFVSVQFTLSLISSTYNKINIMAKTTFRKWNSFKKMLACR